MRFLSSSLRPRVFLLVFLTVFPGILLAIINTITRQSPNIWVVLLVGVFSLGTAWLAGEILIVKGVRTFLHLLKQLENGVWQARSSLRESSGLLAELAPVVDRLAGSLEQQTSQSQQLADQLAALAELSSDLSDPQGEEAILQRILERAMVLLDAPHAALAFYDPLRNELEIAGVQGI